MKGDHNDDRSDDGRKSGPHPSPEELLRYADGDSDPWIAGAIRRHLGECATCRDLAHDLASYPELDPIGDAYQVDEQELRRALGSLRRRLLESEMAADEQPSALAWQDRRRTGSRQGSSERPWAWLIAAAAAIVLVLLGWWAHRSQVDRLLARSQTLEARLDQAERDLRRPLANVPVTVLLATEDPWRAPEVPGVATGSGIMVVIQTEEPLPPENLSAEIWTAAGEIALRIDGLAPRPAGVTFFLPPEGDAVVGKVTPKMV